MVQCRPWPFCHCIYFGWVNVKVPTGHYEAQEEVGGHMELGLLQLDEQIELQKKL